MSDDLSDHPVLVIGDVHGHVERLSALLEQERVKDRDCRVVQLGDLGHFGRETRAADLMAWNLAYEGAIDYVLWGNHDRAVLDRYHEFGGFSAPGPEPLHIMKTMEAQGRLLIALDAHGWLLTHAGLHAAVRSAWKCPADVDLTSAASLAGWLNRLQFDSEHRHDVIDAISGRRGGWSAAGGVLWRDIDEKLYTGVPQIFGHSADHRRRTRGEKDKWYCLDIGGKGGPDDPEADCLAGIWLPSQEIVRVDLKGESPSSSSSNTAES